MHRRIYFYFLLFGLFSCNYGEYKPIEDLKEEAKVAQSSDLSVMSESTIVLTCICIDEDDVNYQLKDIKEIDCKEDCPEGLVKKELVRDE